MYRFIEFAGCANRYLTTNEWNFYVFGATMILPILMIYNPAKYLTNTAWKRNMERKGLASFMSEGAELCNCRDCEDRSKKLLDRNKNIRI